MQQMSIEPISDKELDWLIRMEEKHSYRRRLDLLTLVALYELRDRRAATDCARISITPAGMRMLKELEKGRDNEENLYSRKDKRIKEL